MPNMKFIVISTRFGVVIFYSISNRKSLRRPAACNRTSHLQCSCVTSVTRLRAAGRPTQNVAFKATHKLVTGNRTGNFGRLVIDDISRMFMLQDVQRQTWGEIRALRPEIVPESSRNAVGFHCSQDGRIKPAKATSSSRP
jgi:hypothetical protein